MFNLIVSGGVSGQSRGSITADRVFEHTETNLEDSVRKDGLLVREALLSLPTIIMNEGIDEKPARVVRLIAIEKVLRDYVFDWVVEYTTTNSRIYDLRQELGIADFEFHRNHWAIKSADLYKVLFQGQLLKGAASPILVLAQQPVNERLISFMMPFAPQFTDVYGDVGNKLKEEGYEVRRADDFWVSNHVMDDVIQLIVTSKIVICDLTGKNPNVFYEAGIAHTLGKRTILITQSDDDVPFDLRSIRYIKYLNNGEGRQKLAREVVARVATLTKM